MTRAADDDWVSLLAPERLQAYLRATLNPEGSLTVDGRALSGSSNVTAFITFAGERLVVRRPPGGELLPTAHDMMREARFLRALADTAVPLPKVRAVCEDSKVLGAPFYVMRRVEGLVLQDEEPPVLREPAVLASFCDAVVDRLGELHAVDWRGRDLPGRPDGYLARQLARWRGQLELTPSADRLKGLDRITAWVAEHMPDGRETTIVHGDYGLHNMVVDRGAPRVCAILDWEMATLGDPLADLAWFLQNWGTFHAESGNPANYVTTWSGARTREEMLARYARRTGRSLDHELFYRVFCMWKSIIITEGLYSGFLNGDAANPAVARFVTQVPDQVDAVHALLECARA